MFRIKKKTIKRTIHYNLIIHIIQFIKICLYNFSVLYSASTLATKCLFCYVKSILEMEEGTNSEVHRYIGYKM